MITLYVEETSLRLLVTKGTRVEKWADQALEPGLVRDGVVADEFEVGARIRQLLKIHRVGTKKVTVGLSGLGCLIHPIFLPVLPRALLAEAVRQEMERIIPVPLEQFYLAWQTISVHREQTQVFAVALPCNTVDALVRTLRQAGIEAHSMDLKPLALAGLVKEPTAVIVDTQSTEFDVAVMADWVPQAIRTLSFPQRAQSWAEKRLIIIQEIERTLKFCDSNLLKNPLTPEIPVFISGELTSEPGAAQYLADELKRPVLPLLSPSKSYPGLPLSRCQVNVGLALKKISSGRKYHSSKVNLNVLPEVYRPKAPSPVNMFVPPLMVVAIGALIFLTMQANGAAATTTTMQTQVGQVTQDAAAARSAIKTSTNQIAQLEKQIADLGTTSNALAKALDSFASGQAEANAYLEVVTGTLPEAVNLAGISYSSTGVTLNGTGPSETEILAYATALRASGQFTRILISDIRSADTGMAFQFKLAK